MRQTLFKTLHGSHLYGLATPSSDTDYFTVVTKNDSTTAHTRKRYARQSIVDGIDSTVVDLGTFLIGCEKGVPQFLEAMFSPEAIGDDNITDLRAGYRVGSGVYDTYLRTMKSFAMSDTYKTKRHALRLALNMWEMRATGRFNPRLSDFNVRLINKVADYDSDSVYTAALTWAWY